LLTYSQVDEEDYHHTSVVNMIHDMKGKIRIASERHQDGGLHWHAYVEFTKEVNLRNMRRFDVGILHCHVRYVTKTPATVWAYLVKNVGKGDNSGTLLYDDFPEPPLGRVKAKHRKNEIRDMYARATTAPSRSEALRIIQGERPDHYWKSCFSIERAADIIYPPTVDTTYGGPSLEELGMGWSEWPELKEWVDKYLPSVFDKVEPEECGISSGGPPSLTEDNSSRTSTTSLFGGEDEPLGGTDHLDEDSWSESPPEAYVTPMPAAQQKLSAPQHRPRPKTLILSGPTRTGKTLLVRALGTHMYHSGKFNINVCTPHVDYAIFDDLKDGFHSSNFDYKAWMGGQNEFTVDGKWMRETKFVWNSKPCIFVCNRDPLEGKDGVIRGVDYDWIRANSISVHVETPLHRMALEQM